MGDGAIFGHDVSPDEETVSVFSTALWGGVIKDGSSLVLLCSCHSESLIQSVHSI